MSAGDSEIDHLEISDEAWNVVSRMVEAVWEAYRLDFRDDMELRMNLAKHLGPLSVRLTYNLHLDNPLLQDIKRRYPLAYSMATESAAVLANEYGAMPSEDERGYIALAFALALERHKTEQPKKRLLIVCASGAGTARLLAYKMEQEFGKQLETIQTCNASQVLTVDFSKIDYVVTTIPLPCEVPVPVRHVTLFLDETDRENVRNLLNSHSVNEIAKFFPRELFFSHQKFASKSDAIDFICWQAEQFDAMPSNLKELVWRREETAPTAFGNGVALPHPFEAVSERTFVLVCVLDNPIAWDDQFIQALFFISVARNAGHELDSFYRSVASMLNDKSAIQQLISHQSYDQLLEQLAGKE